MKTKFLRAALFFGIITMAFNACQKDNDDDNPITPSADRDKFMGLWTTTSTGAVHGTLNFSMNITAGTSSGAQIKMENFDGEGSGTFILGNASGSTVSINQQVVNGDTIEGSGTYNTNNTLSFTYTFRDGQTTDNRSATAHH